MHDTESTAKAEQGCETEVARESVGQQLDGVRVAWWGLWWVGNQCTWGLEQC